MNNERHDQEEYEAAVKWIETSPACSNWLSNAYEAALKRDCVDAANDAEVLAKILAYRCKQVLAKA